MTTGIDGGRETEDETAGTVQRRIAFSMRRHAPSGLRRTLSMYIAMNRFKVLKGAESAFENVWLSRDSRLDRVPGFIEFHLLRGSERDDHVLYSSHTVWASKDAFTAWTQSEHFRAAHRDAGVNKPLYLGHPEFEGFEVIQTVRNPHARGHAALARTPESEPRPHAGSAAKAATDDNRDPQVFWKAPRGNIGDKGG
jgi:heme-degrading monooxygenase HmoA